MSMSDLNDKAESVRKLEEAIKKGKEKMKTKENFISLEIIL